MPACGKLQVFPGYSQAQLAAPAGCPQQDIEILAQESGRGGKVMEGAMEQCHQAATPAPKALPRWEPPQHSPGSDNTALTSSHSLGRDPSGILLPFPTWTCRAKWSCEHWGWWCPWMAGSGFPRGKRHPWPAFPSPAGISHPQPQLWGQGPSSGCGSWWQEEHTLLGTLSLSLCRRAQLAPSWAFWRQQEPGLGKVYGMSSGSAD